MTCRLFGAKPLPEPMLVNCPLDPWEQTSVKFESKYKTFHSRKYIWKCRVRNIGHFVQGEMSQIKESEVFFSCMRHDMLTLSNLLKLCFTHLNHPWYPKTASNSVNTYFWMSSTLAWWQKINTVWVAMKFYLWHIFYFWTLTHADNYTSTVGLYSWWPHQMETFSA